MTTYLGMNILDCRILLRASFLLPSIVQQISISTQVYHRVRQPSNTVGVLVTAAAPLAVGNDLVGVQQLRYSHHGSATWKSRASKPMVV